MTNEEDDEMRTESGSSEAGLMMCALKTNYERL